MLLVSQLVWRKNLIQAMMAAQVTAPDAVWRKLLNGWIGFFVFMGVINLYVAYSFSTDFWVNFKLFGGIGLMLVFVLIQAVILAPHMQEKSGE